MKENIRRIKTITVSRKRYNKLLSEAKLISFYKLKTQALELRNQELETEVKKLKMQMELSPDRRKLILAEQLNFVLNEAELINGMEDIYAAENGGLSKTSAQELEETFAFIRENIKSHSEMDDDIRYYQDTLGWGKNYDCPYCDEELDISSRKTETELTVVSGRLELHDFCYIGVKCPGCGYKLPNRYKTFAHCKVVSDRRIRPELISHIICRKYLNHLSLVNQEFLLQNMGICISAYTMSEWITEVCGKWLIRLYVRLAEEIVKSEIIYADNTLISQVSLKNWKPEKEQYIWLYMTPRNVTAPVVFYEMQGDTDSIHSRRFLEKFEGILATDKFDSFKDLPLKITYAGSWAKVRAKFMNAFESMFPSIREGSTAEQGMIFCDKIYAIENRLSEFDTDIRYDIRNKETKKIIDEMTDWAVSSKALRIDFAQKTKTSQAVHYFLENEPALRRFLDDGRMDIDNLCTKRYLKKFVNDENSWRFAPTPISSLESIVLLTIIHTAEANGLDPERYLNYYLINISSGDNIDFDQLLPWNAPHECRKLHGTKE